MYNDDFYNAVGTPCANCESYSQREGDLFCSDECREEYADEEIRYYSEASD